MKQIIVSWTSVSKRGKSLLFCVFDRVCVYVCAFPLSEHILLSTEILVKQSANSGVWIQSLDRTV